jgi:hypothetical protein
VGWGGGGGGGIFVFVQSFDLQFVQSQTVLKSNTEQLKLFCWCYAICLRSLNSILFSIIYQSITINYTTPVPIYKTFFAKTQELRKYIFAFNLSIIYIFFKIILQLLWERNDNLFI